MRLEMSPLSRFPPCYHQRTSSHLAGPYFVINFWYTPFISCILIFFTWSCGYFQLEAVTLTISEFIEILLSRNFFYDLISALGTSNAEYVLRKRVRHDTVGKQDKS